MFTNKPSLQNAKLRPPSLGLQHPSSACKLFPPSPLPWAAKTPLTFSRRSSCLWQLLFISSSASSVLHSQTSSCWSYLVGVVSSSLSTRTHSVVLTRLSFNQQTPHFNLCQSAADIAPDPQACVPTTHSAPTPGCLPHNWMCANFSSHSLSLTGCQLHPLSLEVSNPQCWHPVIPSLNPSKNPSP